MPEELETLITALFLLLWRGLGVGGVWPPAFVFVPLFLPRYADLRGSVDAIVVCHGSEITSK
jgi:hypothetical protein